MEFWLVGTGRHFLFGRWGVTQSSCLIRSMISVGLLIQCSSQYIPAYTVPPPLMLEVHVTDVPVFLHVLGDICIDTAAQQHVCHIPVVSSRGCINLSVCFLDARQRPGHICNSQQPPWHIVPISAYLHRSFCFPLCIVLACSYCIRLDWLLVWLHCSASGWGSGVAEKAEDNTGRQGLDHASHTTSTSQILLHNERLLPKQIGHANFAPLSSFLSVAIFFLPFGSVPCHSFPIFFFYSHSKLSSFLPSQVEQKGGLPVIRRR